MRNTQAIDENIRNKVQNNHSKFTFHRLLVLNSPLYFSITDLPKVKNSIFFPKKLTASEIHKILF